MGIAFYDEKCDNCGRSTPGTFLQVWRHASRSDGIKPQFWCFDCIHGRNFLPEIKNSVTFLFLKKEGKYVPNGTGFLVSVEAEKDLYYNYHQTKHSPYYVMYLVTAKHVLQDSKGEYYPVISIRVNTHDDKSKYLDIDLDKGKMLAKGPRRNYAHASFI
jgi:hypothetical protein